MLPYIVVFFISIISTYFAERYRELKIVFLLFSVVAILGPALLYGLRDENIGTDMRFYMLQIYDNIHRYTDFLSIFTDEIFEPCFLFLVFCGWHLFGSLSGILFLLGLINMVLAYVAIFNMRKTLEPWLAMTFYLFLFFNMSMNIMRQFLAISLCLLAFSLLLHRKYFRVFLLMVLAYFSHSTAFVFIVPIFLYVYLREREGRCDFWVKSYVVLLPFVFVFFDVILQTLISFGVVSEKYSRYFTEDAEGGYRFPMSLFCVSLFIYIVLLSVANFTKRRKYNWGSFNATDSKLYYFHYLALKSMRKDYLVMTSSFSVIAYSAIMLGLTAIVSMWSMRMGLYFQVLNIFLYAYVLKNDISQNKLFHYLFVIGLIVLYWFWQIVVCNDGETYPYTSRILGIYK